MVLVYFLQYSTKTYLHSTLQVFSSSIIFAWSVAITPGEHWNWKDNREIEKGVHLKFAKIQRRKYDF